MIRRTGKKLEAILINLFKIKWDQAEYDIRFEIDKQMTEKTFLKQYTDAVEP